MCAKKSVSVLFDDDEYRVVSSKALKAGTKKIAPYIRNVVLSKSIRPVQDLAPYRIDKMKLTELYFDLDVPLQELLNGEDSREHVVRALLDLKKYISNLP